MNVINVHGEKVKITSDKFISNCFKIVHQNICGLFYKTYEFVTSIADTSPQVVCLTEHHLRSEVVQNINLGQYTLGAQFCRQSQKQGGVLIFVFNNIQFHAINLDHFNREKDLETCALKISLLQKKFYNNMHI